MITKFKIYELSNAKQLEIDEYVICKDLQVDNTHPKNKYLLNNIGQIVSTEFSNHYPYEVCYENMPDDIKQFASSPEHYKNKILIFNNKEILYHSKNKEDLLPFINANKFNI